MARELHAEDRQAIGETLSLHGHIFDGGQLDRLEEIFTPDVVYDLTDAGVGTFEGVEAIRSGALKLGARNPIAHHVTNVVITSAEDDVVTAQSKGLMVMADGAFASVTHLDTLRRHNGGWRISRRVVWHSALRWAEPISLTRATGELALTDPWFIQRPFTTRASQSPCSRKPAAPTTTATSKLSAAPEAVATVGVLCNRSHFWRDLPRMGLHRRARA